MRRKAARRRGRCASGTRALAPGVTRSGRATPAGRRTAARPCSPARTAPALVASSRRARPPRHGHGEADALGSAAAGRSAPDVRIAWGARSRPLARGSRQGLSHESPARGTSLCNGRSHPLAARSRSPCDCEGHVGSGAQARPAPHARRRRADAASPSADGVGSLWTTDLTGRAAWCARASGAPGRDCSTRGSLSAARADQHQDHASGTLPTGATR